MLKICVADADRMARVVIILIRSLCFRIKQKLYMDHHLSADRTRPFQRIFIMRAFCLGRWFAHFRMETVMLLHMYEYNKMF